MKLRKPKDLNDLAEQLIGAHFNRITSIAELTGETSAKDFFENIEAEKVIQSQAFARYIPIIKESVSTKKHDYNLTPFIVFWLQDGEPYIYSPVVTIEHVRHGSHLQRLKRGYYTMIPHNCPRYDLLALRTGCNQHDGSNILDLNFVRHVEGA